MRSVLNLGGAPQSEGEVDAHEQNRQVLLEKDAALRSDLEFKEKAEQINNYLQLGIQKPDGSFRPLTPQEKEFALNQQTLLYGERYSHRPQRLGGGATLNATEIHRAAVAHQKAQDQKREQEAVEQARQREEFAIWGGRPPKK